MNYTSVVTVHDLGKSLQDVHQVPKCQKVVHLGLDRVSGVTPEAMINCSKLPTDITIHTYLLSKSKPDKDVSLQLHNMLFSPRLAFQNLLPIIMLEGLKLSSLMVMVFDVISSLPSCPQEDAVST